ncbi:unnamed protein product [Cylindrotheca closterium]|uniref:rhomboid protease n=1 Tax=Cylindrotheca closterium TaxID=2856 RepID=A0AAD2FNT8_9STRA|nr:unnamed protein product [Cylindrotheca closterium]
MTSRNHNDDHMNLSPSSNEIYLPDDPSTLGGSWEIHGQGAVDDDGSRSRHQEDETHYFFKDDTHEEIPTDSSDSQVHDHHDDHRTSTFLVPADIHPNMEQCDEDIAQLRLLAGRLNSEWGSQEYMTPALSRRIRDFQFAQEKRRKKYGDERPWGILGLYEHLSAIRIDVEWAEDAAWRRANGQPYLSWADFDTSKRNGVNRPFFTYFMLFICTVLLIASIAMNGWVVEPLEVNPMIGPSAQNLIRMGAKDSYLIVNDNEAWRLLSSTVLHAGLVHYFINILALWFVGKAIETSHGMVAAAILFVIPAIGGTILSAIFLPEYITVGASGGIFGLIGACLSDIIMNWKLLFSDFITENGKQHKHAMVIVFLLLDIALNMVLGCTPYVDNWSHLGGMGIGLLCGLSTMERLPSDFFGMEESFWSKAKQIVFRFLGLIVSVIGIIVSATILLRGDGETTPCPSCTWLSCVPFPPTSNQKWWYCDDCGRVTAEIIQNPTLHLQLDCPGGTNVAIGLDADQPLDRKELEEQLPSYCREFCPSLDAR